MIDLRTGCAGLDDLVNLMSASPILRAVSIENVYLSDRAILSQMHELLEFLDITLSITSMTLVPVDRDSDGSQWEAVWARLCSRVDCSTVRPQLPRPHLESVEISASTHR